MMPHQVGQTWVWWGMDNDLFEANMLPLQQLIHGYESLQKHLESWEARMRAVEESCDDPPTPASRKTLDEYRTVVERARKELADFKEDAFKFVKNTKVPKKLRETKWIFDGQGPPHFEAQLREAFEYAAQRTAPLLKHYHCGAKAPPRQDAILAISFAVQLSQSRAQRNHHEPDDTELQEIERILESQDVADVFKGATFEVGGKNWHKRGGLRAAMTALLILAGVPFGEDKTFNLLPEMT